MRIEEAKRLFMQENANLSALRRDGLYDEFLKLQITDDTLKRWEKELMSMYQKVLTGTSSSANVKLQTIYRIDEMGCLNGENVKLILDYYLSCREIDTFSQILLCEVLSRPKYKELLLNNGIDLQEHIDRLIETVREGHFTIDASYKDDPYLDDADFTQDNLLARAVRMKNKFNYQGKGMRQSFLKRIFKKIRK